MNKDLVPAGLGDWEWSYRKVLAERDAAILRAEKAEALVARFAEGADRVLADLDGYRNGAEMLDAALKEYATFVGGGVAVRHKHFNKDGSTYERSAGRVDPSSRVYEVWSEGYRATCDSGSARFLGRVRAVSFEDAVRQLVPDAEWERGRPYSSWGLELFDNEAAARASYG